MNGQPAVVYGIQQTRITTFDVSGSPVSRVLLQIESSEGLNLKFTPEGLMHSLGSGAGWAQRWIHRGFRASLGIAWGLGITSQIQTWSGSAWGAYSEIDTPQALGLILNAASIVPCQVEPHQDKNFSFQAWPDSQAGLELTDFKRVGHQNLSLSLVATGLMQIPDWPTVNNYFAPGYIAAGYIGWAP